MHSQKIPRTVIGKSLVLFTLLFFCGCSQSIAASSDSDLYTLDASKVSKELLRDHLKMGGTNPQGDKISFTSYYMEVNDTPVMPVMGEFHYSRYPAKYWEEEILKMKAVLPPKSVVLLEVR